MREHLVQLFADPFRTDARDRAGMLADGLGGRWFDLKIETTGETHRPKQSQVIFFEAMTGFANRADEAGFKIDLPAHVIDDAILNRIVEQAVDREIAALGIFFRRGEDD